MLHAALRFKRPVYIELPRDLVAVPGISHHKTPELHERSDSRSLREALAEAEQMINRARQPVILADVEVHRFGLQDQLLKLARKTNIPVAATVLGKSVIGEHHPFYLGIYEGAMGRDDVRQYVESSDCVILLGAFMTDINLGIYTARLDPARSISATSEKLSIRYHTYEEVRFKDFVAGLLRLRLRRRKLGKIPRPAQITPHSALCASHSRRPMTVRRLFERLNAFLSDSTVVVADVGDALFGAADLFIRERTEFISPAYYTSMGFAVPASIGAQLANPKLRPLVLVGDGAFQMTGMELATVGPLRAQPGGGAAQQPRLWHRAAHAGRPLQRRLAVAIPSPAGDPRGGPRVRRRNRGRAGPRAGRSGAVDGELLSAGSAPGAARPLAGAGPPGGPPGPAALGVSALPASGTGGGWEAVSAPDVLWLTRPR